MRLLSTRGVHRTAFPLLRQSSLLLHGTAWLGSWSPILLVSSWPRFFYFRASTELLANGPTAAGCLFTSIFSSTAGAACPWSAFSSKPMEQTVPASPNGAGRYCGFGQRRSPLERSLGSPDIPAASYFSTGPDMPESSFRLRRSLCGYC